MYSRLPDVNISGQFSAQAHIHTEPSCQPPRRPIISRADETKSQDELKNAEKEMRKIPAELLSIQVRTGIYGHSLWLTSDSKPATSSMILLQKRPLPVFQEQRRGKANWKGQAPPPHTQDFKSCMNQGGCYREW